MQSAHPEKIFHYNKDPLAKGELSDLLRQIYGPENVRKYKYDYRSPVFQKRRERFYCVTAILALGEKLFTTEEKREAAALKAKEKTQTDDPAAATVEVLEKYRSRFLLASHREIHSAAYQGKCDGEGMFYLLQTFFREKTNSQRPAADAFLACNFLAEQGINVDYTDPQDSFRIEQGKITFEQQGKATCIGYILGKTPPPIIVPPSARRSSTHTTTGVSETISKREADTPKKTADPVIKNRSSSSAKQDKREKGNYSPRQNHTPVPPKTPPRDFTPAPSYTPAPNHTPSPSYTPVPSSTPENSVQDNSFDQLEQSFENLRVWLQNSKTTLSDGAEKIKKQLPALLKEAEKLATTVKKNSTQALNDKMESLSKEIANFIAGAKKSLKTANNKVDRTAKRSLQSLITILENTRRYLTTPPAKPAPASSRPSVGIPIPRSKKQEKAPPLLIPIPKKHEPKPRPLKTERRESSTDENEKLWQIAQKRYSIKITKDLTKEDGPFCFEGNAKVAGETIELLIYGNPDNPQQRLNKLNNKLALLGHLIPIWRKLFGKLNLKARLTENDVDRVFLRAEKLNGYTLIFDFTVPANLTFEPTLSETIEEKSNIKVTVDRGKKDFTLFHDDRLAAIIHSMENTEKAMAALRLFEDFYLFITQEAQKFLDKSKLATGFSSHWDYATKEIRFIDNDGKLLFKIANGQPFFDHFILRGNYADAKIRTLFQTELQKAAAAYLKKSR